MPFNPPRLLLASKSPRRYDLLSKMGFSFTVQAPDVDEFIMGAPREAVKTLAERKAKAAAKDIGDAWIIAADTLVSLNDQALGKPKDEQDAFRMLSSLSGNIHQVYTGVCLLDAQSGAYESVTVRSDVLFKKLSEDEILAYIKTGEPIDKAGAYAIQGNGGMFVEKFEGSYDNIVGFPTEEFKKMYDAFLLKRAEE